MLRRFDSGVMVIQSKNQSDDEVRQAWLSPMRPIALLIFLANGVFI